MQATRINLAESNLICIVLAVAGTAITAAVFYPGYLDGDSSGQNLQAVSGIYIDTQPVVMAWVWSYLNLLIEGSGGLFLLTTFFFWLGLGLVLRNFSGGLASFLIAAFALGLIVPNFAMLSQIQKDVGMAAAFMLAYGLLLAADRKKSWLAAAAAFAALWYGLAVRYNGVLALLPFAIYLAILLARELLPEYFQRRLASGWRRVALGLAIVALMIGTVGIAADLILGDKGQRYPAIKNGLYVYDLAGISVRSNRNYFPRGFFYPVNPLRLSELQSLYHPHTIYDLIFEGIGSQSGRRIPQRIDGSDPAIIEAAWLDAIRSEPGAYLAHRWELWLAHLGILANTPYRTVMFVVWSEREGRRSYFYPYRGPTVFDTVQNRWVVETLAGLSRSAWFKPWIYFALGLLTWGLAWWTRSRHLVHISLLGGSAVLYSAPYAVMGVSAEFRYLWWPVLASMLAFTIFIEGFRAGHKSPNSDRLPNSLAESG